MRSFAVEKPHPQPLSGPPLAPPNGGGLHPDGILSPLGELEGAVKRSNFVKL